MRWWLKQACFLLHLQPSIRLIIASDRVAKGMKGQLGPSFNHVSYKTCGKSPSFLNLKLFIYKMGTLVKTSSQGNVVRTCGCHEFCPPNIHSSPPLVPRIVLFVPFHTDTRCCHCISSCWWNISISGTCHYWKEALRASMQLRMFLVTAALSVLTPKEEWRENSPNQPAHVA